MAASRNLARIFEYRAPSHVSSGRLSGSPKVPSSARQRVICVHAINARNSHHTAPLSRVTSVRTASEALKQVEISPSQGQDERGWASSTRSLAVNARRCLPRLRRYDGSGCDTVSFWHLDHCFTACSLLLSRLLNARCNAYPTSLDLCGMSDLIPSFSGPRLDNTLGAVMLGVLPYFVLLEENTSYFIIRGYRHGGVGIVVLFTFVMRS